MIDNITNWFRKHKPWSWKDIFLIVFFLKSYKTLFFWYIIGLCGFLLGGEENVDLNKYYDLFREGGQKIGNVYEESMIKIFKIGFDLGDSLGISTSYIGLIISNLFYLITILVTLASILFVIIYIINLIMYRKKC